MFEEQSRKNYYLFMDGMRGAAVLWVMLHHIYFVFGVRTARYYLNEFFRLGFLGVDVFFVISGFLITGLLAEDLEGRLRIGRFYLRRFFKIVPQYYFAVMTAFLIFFFDPAFAELRSVYPSKLWMSYFFFIQNFVANMRPLGHTWSLAIEEHYYLVYPVIVGTVFHFIADASRRRRILSLVCCGLVVAINGFRFWIFQNMPQGNPFEPSQIQWTLTRVDALFFGCWLKFQEPRLMALPNRKALGVLLKVLGTAGFLYFVIYNFFVDDWYAYTLVYLAAGCLLVAGLLGVPGIFMSRILRWVGKSSYGIYLWHYILIWLFFPKFFMSKNSFWIAAYVLTAVFAGWLSTATIEHWSLNFRKKIAP